MNFASAVILFAGLFAFALIVTLIRVLAGDKPQTNRFHSGNHSRDVSGDAGAALFMMHHASTYDGDHHTHSARHAHPHDVQSHSSTQPSDSSAFDSSGSGGDSGGGGSDGGGGGGGGGGGE